MNTLSRSALFEMAYQMGKSAGAFDTSLSSAITVLSKNTERAKTTSQFLRDCPSVLDPRNSITHPEYRFWSL